MSTALRAMTGTRQVVGIAEMKVAAGADDVLVTYALGSCVGVAIYDPVARVGGMLHAMLPDSRIDPERAVTNPSRFIDTGVPALFRACYAAGARKERLLVHVAGGAATQDEGSDSFQIGARNLVMLRKLFWKNGVMIRGEDVGGSQPRTLILEVPTGAVIVRRDGIDIGL